MLCLCVCVCVCACVCVRAIIIRAITILGPLLFLIYINDLPLSLSSSNSLLFANDTKCFKSIKESSGS